MLYGTVAATGSAQTDAAQITARFTTVSGGDGSVGVILTSNKPGDEFFVYNAAATGGVKVYPPSGCDINDGSQNAAVVIEGKSLGIFVCMDGVTFGGIYTTDT